MVPTWMIEELEQERQEQAEREERARRWIEVPSPAREAERSQPDHEGERGVVTIDVL